MQKLDLHKYKEDSKDGEKIATILDEIENEHLKKEFELRRRIAELEAEVNKFRKILNSNAGDAGMTALLVTVLELYLKQVAQFLSSLSASLPPSTRTLIVSIMEEQINKQQKQINLTNKNKPPKPSTNKQK